MANKINIGLIDDQLLFVRSLSTLIKTFIGFSTVIEAQQASQLFQYLTSDCPKPDILLIDVHMPGTDGIELAKRLSEVYPFIKLVALSTDDDDVTIIKMIKAGCCSYMLKEIHPDELEKALREIYLKGYYNADYYNINYRRLLVKATEEKTTLLSGREKEFITLAASENTYKYIAGQMHVSERTVDGYRESVFEKLKVQSRVGMVLEGIRLKLIELPS